jgi:hypothetical protein
MFSEILDGHHGAGVPMPGAQVALALLAVNPYPVRKMLIANARGANLLTATHPAPLQSLPEISRLADATTLGRVTRDVGFAVGMTLVGLRAFPRRAWNCDGCCSTLNKISK